MLRPSSVENEYYLTGDKPGTLQYNIDQNTIRNYILPENLEDCGFYQILENYDDIRLKITPHTKANINWEIILAMRCVGINGEIWLKCALLNKNNNKIALLTSTDKKITLIDKIHRAIKTIGGEYFVGHFRMSAPVVFWKTLQDII